MRVLINVPDLQKTGGVSSLFNNLKIEKYQNISLFQVTNSLVPLLRIPLKYLEFISAIRDVQIVHLNPSLNKKSFYRDAIFAFLTKLFNKKLIVYWHGWDDTFESNIANSRLLTLLFTYTYGNADLTIVLGSVFASKLNKIARKNLRIVIESNAASDIYIQRRLIREISFEKPLNLLFLARVELEKGVYIAIDAFKELAKSHEATLTIAGSGSELMNVRAYVKANLIENVKILGHIDGKSKHQLLVESDMLILPTFHGEGMPISIIEGMLYGLPIVSRPIGGIPDWVSNDINGILLESLKFNDYAQEISRLINNPTLYNQISENNSAKAFALFTPLAVSTRLKSYYSSIV